jgi:hypothetical protein
MKGTQHFFNSPLFCFHDNCGKVCPSDSDFFGLSRSKKRARNRKRKSDGKLVSSLNWKLHIVSENNFPTAAGLASSAAGYGCLG